MIESLGDQAGIPVKVKACGHAWHGQYCGPRCASQPTEWLISIKGRYLGKCEGTQTDILAACGPYVIVQGNHIDIWAIVK
jgi:hypothetical protein